MVRVQKSVSGNGQIRWEFADGEIVATEVLGKWAVDERAFDPDVLTNEFLADTLAEVLDYVESR